MGSESENNLWLYMETVLFQLLCNVRLSNSMVNLLFSESSRSDVIKWFGYKMEILMTFYACKNNLI